MSTSFDRLERSFLGEWARRDPMRAVEMGRFSPFDGRVPEATAERMEQDLLLLKRTRTALERVPVARLSTTRRLDAGLMKCMLDQWIFERDVLRRWESIPVAPRLIGECLYQVLGRNYAPLKLRMRKIMVRLELLPRLVDQSRSMLRRPVKILIENELETITRLPAFFHTLKEIGRLNLPPTPTFRLAKQVHTLQNAVEQYYNWLIIDVLSECTTTHVMDPDLYADLARARGIGASPETLARSLAADHERLKGRLREMARRMKRRLPLEDLRDRLKANHPAEFDGVLKFMREAVGRTREFVDRSGFATLPSRESFYVVEMPTYLRHVQPLSLTGPCTHLDGKAEGYFMVSPGDCDSDRLKEFSHSAMTGMTLREGYPGRHLMQASAPESASPLRRLYQAPAMAEGWVFYAEERAREMGYDDTPQGHFLSTLEEIARVTRATIDLRIHAGKITGPEAVNLLIDEVGMDRIVAEAEVRRILLCPTEALDGLWGREQIRELRRETRDRLKAHFNEKTFHDALLRAGALPPPLMKQWLLETLKAPKEDPIKVAAKPAPAKKKPAQPKAKAKPKPKPKKHPPARKKHMKPARRHR